MLSAPTRFTVASTALGRVARLAPRASIMRTPTDPSPPALSRDLRLDFFRGVALICIFIDHIPENYLNYFTLSAIGFSDAAEVFIFVSGFTASLVYGRAMMQRGVLWSTAQ